MYGQKRSRLKLNDEPTPTMIIDYLCEENRVIRAQVGGRRVRLNDDQRSGRTEDLATI